MTPLDSAAPLRDLRRRLDRRGLELMRTKRCWVVVRRGAPVRAVEGAFKSLPEIAEWLEEERYAVADARPIPYLRRPK